MDHPVAAIAAAAGIFAGTNVDDLLILTLLFLSSRAGGRPKPWQIWAGQYAGIAVLVAVSAAAALGLTVVPDDKVHFLGLIPIGLGVWTLLRRNREETAPLVAKSAWAIAAVTIANGADNIAVYTPVFRTITLGESFLTVVVFAVLIVAWILAGSWLGSHRRAVTFINRYGHWVVPGVFIVIGTVILLG